MKKKDRDLLSAKIDNEGLDYAFREYSSFSEIKDEEFHRLRQQYVDSAKALIVYLRAQGVEV